ncbi:hypothetical protein ABFS82_08G063900 [Erythranthe guttata]|nr:PREDICTED: transcription factor bHLH61 [Erythranthe guttata]|eukprot:XP_012856598.1 PREDICTED: transcription factor bHLH61 [Erythranthe guttata]
MEITEQQSMMIEELIMAPKIDTNFPNDQFLPNHWSNLSNPFDQTLENNWHLPSPNYNNPSPIISEFSYNYNNNPNCSSFGEFQPFLDALTSPDFSSFYDLPPMPAQQDYAATTNFVQDEEMRFLDTCIDNYGFQAGVEDGSTTPQNHDIIIEKKSNKSKKPNNGQPSKNLMAERRRRKRLNDRLSMLRSIVPKISKMDRTSILGDTIDYMRELLDKIQNLREQGVDENTNKINLNGAYLKELKPNEIMQVMRNPPKFDVERRDEDTRVEVCCTAKPGLLFSTLSTMDALGLDIQQCVISCFSDFSLQASCCEVSEHRSVVSIEDVKQALFRNAGYGGRCL